VTVAGGYVGGTICPSRQRVTLQLEARDLGNEDGAMPKEQSPGKPTTRRYTPDEKASAVRMVQALRAELGLIAGRCSGSLASSGTASSRCGPGCVRPTSTTVTPWCFDF
jgi:hypothetical protein